MSFPKPPISVSAPSPPLSVSLPAPPSSTFTPVLPVKTLFSVLPVPLMANDPVSVRFSTFADRIRLMLLSTVSVPAPAASVTTSPTLSTTYRSSPTPPASVSAPNPPISVSLPAPPSRTLAPVLPVNTFAPPLPVPLMATDPVSVRFSTFSAKLYVTLL